ncbi:MAG: hypothetical protein P1U37_04380 [Minwuia sp.]|nr:hypothetical protein [Minwuia sp.]
MATEQTASAAANRGRGGADASTPAARKAAHARRSHYEPSTFLERGTVIPFTTTALAQCRVRLDERERLEVVLPGFSGSKGIYVTAFSSLPEITTLSVHDRTLTEIVGKEKAVTPTAIRHCWLELATTGIGGQALAEQAREELTQAAEVQVATRIMLLLDTVRRGGGEIGPELIASIGSSEGRNTVSTMLGGAASRANITAIAIDQHIEEMAAMLGTLGLRSLPEPGRLRHLHTRMQEFSHAIDNWGRTTVSDLAHIGRFAAMSAEHSAGIAGRAIAEVDRTLADPIRLMARWDSGREVLRSHLLRIAWLLDGWDYVLRIWDDAIAERMAIDVAAREIGRIIPIVPAREVDAGAGQRSVELFREYRSRVRVYEDWLSGDLDEDLLARPGPLTTARGRDHK